MGCVWKKRDERRKGAVREEKKNRKERDKIALVGNIMYVIYMYGNIIMKLW